jgi:hypothetical protein
MNAADIRDMGGTQSLYWTVAIPVTVVVLAVAFVYGYKGDEIGDWVHDTIHARNAARFLRRAAGGGDQAAAGSWEGRGSGQVGS